MNKCIKERIIKMNGWMPETEESGDGLVAACLQEVLHVAQVHHQAPRHALHLREIRTF
jgi:hypothetical protein